MKLLAIDTATERASIGLMVDGDYRFFEQDGARQHAASLLPTINTLLDEAGIHLSQLDGIAFDRGPASFTGLRVACSVVKGLAFAHDLAVFPVSSLTAIASETWLQYPESNAVLTCIDARMQQVYWTLHTKEKDEPIEQVSAMRDITISDKITSLVLAGVAFEAYQAEMPELLVAKIKAYYPIFPGAAALIRLVTEGKIKPVDAALAQPVYVRNQITQGEKGG